MPVENTTPNRGYALPNGANFLTDDVLRIIAAIAAIDVDMAARIAEIVGKAPLVHGHVPADVTGLVSALASKQDVAGRGSANGYAALGADGKIPASQLPDAVLGSLRYQTDWNATTNTPTIPAAAAGNRGWYYIVSTAGGTNVSGITDWEIGDWIVSDGTKWSKIDNTDQVLSVAGLRGAITAMALFAALGLGTAATKAIGDFASAASAVLKNADAALAAGYTSTVVDDGTKSSGTYTPSPAGGNFRKIANNGAFTFAAPTAAGDYSMIVQIVNGASAGAITFTGGATAPGGSAYNTTNGNKFNLHITKLNGTVSWFLEALQ